MGMGNIAAAVTGFGQGLDAGAKALKEATERRQKKELADRQLAQKDKDLESQAIRDKAALMQSGLDEQGNMLPGFGNDGENYFDAQARRKREADDILIPGSWAPPSADRVQSQQGFGPTALGANTGLGSLVDQTPKGLEGLSQFAGKNIDPKLLNAYVGMNKNQAGANVLGSRPDIAAAISSQQRLNPEQIQYLSGTPEGRSIFNSSQQAANQARLGDQYDRSEGIRLRAEAEQREKATRMANSLSPATTRSIADMKSLQTGLNDVMAQLESDKINTGWGLGMASSTGLANGSGPVGGTAQSIGSKIGATTPEERQFLKSYNEKVLDFVKAKAGTTFTDRFVESIEKSLPSVYADKKEFRSQMSKILEKIEQEAANAVNAEVGSKGGDPNAVFQSVWGGSGNIPGAKVVNPQRAAPQGKRTGAPGSALSPDEAKRLDELRAKHGRRS